MISYVNSTFGIRILARVHGSALYNSVLPALISCAIYLLVVSANESTYLQGLFIHPYPMQALVTAFTFLLVFRANYSYARWWEAYTNVYLMHSKWLDMATEIAAFHYQSKRYNEFKPPSFGANPGVQCLDPNAFKSLRVSDSAYFYKQSQDRQVTPIGSLGVASNIVRFNTPPKAGKETKYVPITPNERTRHTRQATLTDLMEQMDACEAEEAKQKRQNLIAEETKEIDNDDDDDDDDKDDVQNRCDEIDDIFSGAENGFDRYDSEIGEIGKEASGKQKRSLFRKIKDKRSESKVRRKMKKLEKSRCRADSISVDLGTVTTIPKTKRRRSRHVTTKRQPATERLVKGRRSLAISNQSLIRQERELLFCDRYDLKTGKPYSKFTAVSRKNLREGNLDPDGVPPMLFLEECAHLLSLMSAVAFSTLRNDLPEAESPLTAFDPGLPWPLKDPDEYKGNVRKGWTRSKSRLYSVLQFTLGQSRNDRARTLYNAARPFRVIGNVSDAEIEKIQKARGALAKVSLISMWLMELISREYQAGSTGDVAAPIISRLYQFVSDGMAGYNQARKIAYIPFPFPHAQITTLYLLVVDFIVTPLLMSAFVTDTKLGLILNLFSVLCFTGLYQVAREIECPFQNVPNDVPLNNYQAQFNEGLMVMFYGYHPDAYWNKKPKSNTDYTATAPSDQRNHESSNTLATAKINVSEHNAHYQREISSDGKIATVSDDKMPVADTSSRASNSETTNNESLQIPQRDSLTTNLNSEPINLSIWNSGRDEGLGPNETTNNGRPRRRSSHPTSDIQMHNFLRNFNCIDDSFSSFFKDDQRESQSSPVVFRIPNKTNNLSAGTELPSGESDFPVALPSGTI